MRKFYEAVHVDMYATPTCFSKRQGLVKMYALPKCFSMRQCSGNVQHFHVLFYYAVHVEMYATPTCFSMAWCTWECTPFPRDFLWRSARGNVRHSHGLFYEAVHVEMYAISTCFSLTQCTWKCMPVLRVWHQQVQYCCALSHVTVHILVSISTCLSCGARGNTPFPMCLFCDDSTIFLWWFSMWQWTFKYKILTCLSMLQCT
jgi:hypothetical protein